MNGAIFYIVTIIHHSGLERSQAQNEFLFIDIGKRRSENNDEVKKKPAEFINNPPVSSHYHRIYFVIIVLSSLSWPEQGRVQFPKY